MPVFVELTTDAFEEVLSSQTNRRTATGRGARAGSRIARRPTRGLEVKEDTPAALKVILSDGSELPLIDSSSPDGISQNGYTNFILQSVSEARMEKHQIVETFGAAYIFFFGENPRFLDVQAVLVNSFDFNWEAEWWENYNENFRGTKLVEKGGRLYMFYDDNIVEGYMLMCNATKSSDQPFLIQMSFRLFLTNYRNVSFIGSPQFPVHTSVVIPDEALQRSPQIGITNASQDFFDLVTSSGRGLPLRGRISENLDEFVGLSENQIVQSGITKSGVFTSNPQSAITTAERGQLETEDMPKEAVKQLEAHGADIDSPESFSGLGMQPFFSVGAKTGATFRPQEQEPFGFDVGKDATLDNPVDGTSQFRKDPLGAIFGGSENNDRAKDNRFTEGAGDAEYGFHSDFSSGPGFGEAGFGDFGGPGFGSGQGATGDPGFKDPNKFTFAGVAKNRAAFNKFVRPRPDQTAFGKGEGIGSSSAGLSGGASVRIDGKQSAFSLISIPGTLKVF